MVAMPRGNPELIDKSMWLAGGVPFWFWVYANGLVVIEASVLQVSEREFWAEVCHQYPQPWSATYRRAGRVWRAEVWLPV